MKFLSAGYGFTPECQVKVFYNGFLASIVSTDHQIRLGVEKRKTVSVETEDFSSFPMLFPE
jgi:hypothetical protein